MKLIVKSLGCVPDETLVRNLALSPELPEPIGTGHLAVVGGGPSIWSHIERLRNWTGDVWAINGAYRWCIERGINASFMTIDPQASVADLARGALRSVLAEHCDPSVFKAVASATKAKRPFLSPTSAVAASLIAIKAGYSRLTYFGCESSYDDEQTHAYMDDEVPDLIRVRCNGQEFLTELEYLAQAEKLSAIIRIAPSVFFEESGGLLRAMIADQDVDTIAVSRRIFENMAAA